MRNVKHFLRSIYVFFEKVYHFKYWDNIHLLSLFTTVLFMLVYCIIAVINYIGIFWDEFTLILFCFEYGIMHVKITSLSILTGLIASGIVFPFWFTRAFRNILGNFKRSSIIKFTVVALAPAILVTLVGYVINEYATYLLNNAVRARNFDEYVHIRDQFISLDRELVALLPLIIYPCLLIYFTVLPAIVFGSSPRLNPGVRSERSSIIVMSFITLLIAGLITFLFSIPLSSLLDSIEFMKQPLIKPDEYLLYVLYGWYRRPFPDVCYYAREYYENLYPNIKTLTLILMVYPYLIIYYYLAKKLIVSRYLEPYM